MQERLSAKKNGLKPNDPRQLIKSELERTRLVAREAQATLEAQEAALESIREALFARLDDLARAHRILSHALDASATQALTKATAKDAPPSPPKPAASASTAGAAASPSRAAASSWSPGEDSTLLTLLEQYGLTRWPAVAEALHAELQRTRIAAASLQFGARPSITVRRRWETLLAVFLSCETAPGLRKTSELVLAAHRAVRVGEKAMNESASVLTRAKSVLSLATVQSRKLQEQARRTTAREAGQLRIKVQGQTAEHVKLQQVLDADGPAKLLARKLDEAGKLQKGEATETLQQELGLESLLIEAVALGGPTPRYALKVRDVRTSELVVEWETPHDQRTTAPKGAKQEPDAFTKKLHGIDEGGSGSEAASVASSRSGASTPR